MKYKTRISIIIPTIGRIEQLSACLQSLFCQSILPDEIVVVDNSAIQKAKPLIKQLSTTDGRKIKYVWESQKGVAFARNAGIRKAKYDLLAFIDDDCIADKNWVKNIINLCKINRKLILQGKNYNGLTQNLFACLEHYSTESFILCEVYKDKTCIFSKLLDTKNCAFRKSIFPGIPHFDTRFLRVSEDIDFGFKAREREISVIYQPKLLVSHYGRSSLINHLVREFYKGRDFYRFQKKWQAEDFDYKKITEILKDSQQKKIKRIEHKLKSQILKRKSFIFKIEFNILQVIDEFIRKTGYYFEEVNTAMKRTRNFLPRRIFTRTILSHKGR